MAEKVDCVICENNCDALSEVIAKVIYVLTKVYKVERKTVATVLLNFVEDADLVSKEFLQYVLHKFLETSLDYVDCVLLAYHLLDKTEVFTFDQKLQKFLRR